MCVCRCFSFLRRKKVDVLMLQEIHANLSSEDEWCRILKGFHFFSGAFEDAQAGLASETPILSDFFVEGFVWVLFFSVDFVRSNQNIYIINVYCPSDSAERDLLYFFRSWRMFKALFT